MPVAHGTARASGGTDVFTGMSDKSFFVLFSPQRPSHSRETKNKYNLYCSLTSLWSFFTCSTQRHQGCPQGPAKGRQQPGTPTGTGFLQLLLLLQESTSLSLHRFNKPSDAATTYISLVLVLESDLSRGFVQGEAGDCTAQEEPRAGTVGITIPSPGS